MAKLNGVKIIDMVGGEVTKIAYEGSEYTKVDGVGDNGDIALRISHDKTYVKVGEYYPTDYDGGLVVIDDDGDNIHARTGRFVFFRKVNAQPSAYLADEVQALGNEVESLDARVSKLEGKSEMQDAKPADAIVEGGHTIVPQVGDKIRIVDAWIARGNYENGDVFTVKEVLTKAGAVYVKEHSRAICRKEFVIIERPEKAALSAGKYVKFAEDDWGISADKYYEVKSGRNDSLCIIDDDGDERYSTLIKPEIFKITEIVDAPPKPTLKVGDYAKVVDDNNGNNNGSIKAGEIVEIIKDDKSFIPYVIKSVTSGVTVWARPSHIVKATDEEVAQAQTQAAEIKKWAKIGRKPGEFKKGDIVGYKTDGEMCEVIDINADGAAKVNTVRHGICAEKDDIELITPVEQRFDM